MRQYFFILLIWILAMAWRIYRPPSKLTSRNQDSSFFYENIVKLLNPCLKFKFKNQAKKAVVCKKSKAFSCLRNLFKKSKFLSFRCTVFHNNLICWKFESFLFYECFPLSVFEITNFHSEIHFVRQREQLVGRQILGPFYCGFWSELFC